jgi:hypothetical protein
LATPPFAFRSPASNACGACRPRRLDETRRVAKHARLHDLQSCRHRRTFGGLETSAFATVLPCDLCVVVDGGGDRPAFAAAHPALVRRQDPSASPARGDLGARGINDRHRRGCSGARGDETGAPSTPCQNQRPGGGAARVKVSLMRPAPPQSQPSGPKARPPTSLPYA